MKKDLLKTEYLPLGIRLETVIGMSRILEIMVEEYVVEFPMRCIKKPASINKGAMTFKLFPVKRRKRK